MMINFEPLYQTLAQCPGSFVERALARAAEDGAAPEGEPQGAPTIEDDVCTLVYAREKKRTYIYINTYCTQSEQLWSEL